MPSIPQGGFNNSFSTFHCLPYLHNLQPSRVQESPPLLLRPLHSSVQSHHLDIQRRREQSRVGVRKDEFADEKLRVAAFHGRGRVAEDLTARNVRPIVEYGAEVVCTGVCCSGRSPWLAGSPTAKKAMWTFARKGISTANRLRLEKVMWHGFDGHVV